MPNKKQKTKNKGGQKAKSKRENKKQLPLSARFMMKDIIVPV